MHAAGELPGERLVVDVAVAGGALDCLPRYVGRDVARGELLLDLDPGLHSHRQRPNDEEPRPHPRERLLDRSATRVVDLVPRRDIQLEECLRLDAKPGLAIEPERDRATAFTCLAVLVGSVVLDRQPGHGGEATVPRQ